MKIAVSAVDPSLDARVDPRLGRCACFVLVDPATMAFEAIDNPGGASAQGAGIATAQMIASKGVEAVLTGNCGPNAYQALTAAGVTVITGVTGTVRDAAHGFKEVRYRGSAAPNVGAHFGMGVSAPGKPGMGAAQPRPSPSSGADSPLVALLEELQGQLETLRSQVEQVNRRIDELHKRE